jgi:hypothetical protein
MWDYIVLGQIPGTQIRVSFTGWLIVTAILGLCVFSLASVRFVRTSRLLAAWHIRHILQTAAYAQLLANRRHMQA